MKFPIFEIKGNQITNMHGGKSYFYEIVPLDYETMSVEDHNVHCELLLKKLNQIKAGEWMKYYRLGDDFYLNSSEKVDQFLNHNILKMNRPLDILFKDDGEVVFNDDFLTFGLKYYRVLTVVDYPPMVSMFEFDGYGDYIVKFKRQKKEVSKKTLAVRRRLHHSSLFESLRNIESESAYNEIEEVLEKVTKDEDSLFEIEVSLLISADTKKGLDTRTEQIVGMLRDLGGRSRVEKSYLPYCFYEFIPGVDPAFRRKVLTDGVYLSNLFVLQRDFLMEDGTTLHSNSDDVVKFDLFDSAASNFNLLITGSSGQGKSMIGNKIIYDEIRRGTKVVILDKGNSFLRNIQYNNGTVLSDRFNPLQFRDPVYLKEFVLSVVGDKWDRVKEGKLLECIKSAVKIDDLDFDSFISRLAKDFKEMPYYFSELAPCFRGKDEQLQDLVYADLSIYPDAIKAPLIIYLIEYFKNLEGRKIFLFDECWELLIQNARYIAECFRTFRKFNASAIAISQGLEDFTRDDLGRIIFQNSYYRAFFRQDTSGVEFLNNGLKAKIEKLQSIKGVSSEFLLSVGDRQKVLRYYASPFEFELFHTDSVRNQVFGEYWEEKGRFIPFREAFNNFVEICHPGVSRVD